MRKILKSIDILFIPVLLWVLLISFIFVNAKAEQIDLEESLASSVYNWQNLGKNLAALQENSLFSITNPPGSGPKIVKEIAVISTGYSSSVDQTDSTPFITASGTQVRDGIVAANFLPFGTKIRLPALYGDKIFVVEDRMHPRKRYQVDIWFSSREAAINFGAERTYIEVLES